MTAVVVAVYDPSGNLISYIPRRKGVQWLDELNGPGSASFVMHLDDAVLAATPNALDGLNVVRFSVAGRAVKAWRIESVTPARVAQTEDARSIQISGRGLVSALEDAVVYPEYGLRNGSADDRVFSFASKDGPWRVPSEWVAPQGVRQDKVTDARKGAPKDWFDHAAQWLWSTSPTAAAASGVNWFRGSFTLPTDATVGIYATCDNAMDVYLDGEQILTTDGDNKDLSWRVMSSKVGRLAAGTHLIAAAVLNDGGPGGFLCSAYALNSKGVPGGVLTRTAPTGWQVRGYGPPPGWFGASVIKTLMAEAVARGVLLGGLKRNTFNDATDSSGAAWLKRSDQSLRVGTTNLYAVLSQISEIELDFVVNPASLELELYNRKGLDLTSQVRLMPGNALTGSSSTANYSSLANQAIVRFDAGWLEYATAGSKVKYGRREVGITLGGVQSYETAAQTAQALFDDSSIAQVTHTVTITAEAGPQPYEDFNLGDTVTSVGFFSGTSAGRVMSISGSEESDTVNYSIDLYPPEVL